VCDRCGEKVGSRKKESHAGVICESCALKVKAARETRISCPGDGTTMAKELLGDSIIIDRCPECQGVWLDAGELAAVARHSKGRTGSRGLFVLAMLGAGQ